MVSPHQRRNQQQYERVSNDAAEIFGLDNVTNELQIVAHSQPSWVDAFPIVSQPLLTEVEDGTIEISGERITLGGVVASSDTRTAVETELKEQFQALSFESRLHVRPPSEIEARIRDVLQTRRIEFESNGARLTPGGRRALDRVAAILREHPLAEIEISGHTDNWGEPSYNLSLSQRRADSVRNHLAGLIEVNGFSTIGYGAERPVASNRTAEGRQRNRRIEFRVLREN